MVWLLVCHIASRKTGFSPDNVEWAEKVLGDNKKEIPSNLISTHNAIINAFVGQIREIIEKKQSFKQIITQAKKKSEAHNNSSGD